MPSRFLHHLFYCLLARKTNEKPAAISAPLTEQDEHVKTKAYYT